MNKKRKTRTFNQFYKSLIISREDRIAQMLRDVFGHFMGYESELASTSTQAITFIKKNDYDFIFFYAYTWEQQDDILDTVRKLRLEGYSGAVLLASASPHSLCHIATSYPLSTLVDAVLEVPIYPPEIKRIVELALLRSQDRKLGRQERDALWLLSEHVFGPHAIGFKFSLD